MRCWNPTAIDHTHRDLTDEDVKRIATTYHAWRGEKDAGMYEDVPGFCKSASIEEVEKLSFVLSPGRFVGAEELGEDDETFAETMTRLTVRLGEQFKESAELETLSCYSTRK